MPEIKDRGYDLWKVVMRVNSSKLSNILIAFLFFPFFLGFRCIVRMQPGRVTPRLSIKDSNFFFKN